MIPIILFFDGLSPKKMRENNNTQKKLVAVIHGKNLSSSLRNTKVLTSHYFCDTISIRKVVSVWPFPISHYGSC